MTNEILLFIAILGIAYLYLTSVPLARRVRRLKKMLRTERTRAHWGEARAELFALVRDRKLDIRSETFQTLYPLQTFVLRRPEEYDEISRLIANAMLDRRSQSERPSWIHEREDWPPEMASVLHKTAQGTIALAFDYPGLRRITASLLRWSPWIALHLGRRAFHRLAQSAGRIPAVRQQKELIDAAKAMQRLSSGRRDDCLQVSHS